jgi:hypothetical protein
MKRGGLFYALFIIFLLAMAILAFGDTALAQGSISGNGSITVVTGSATGTPAFALNGVGAGISNDENHTSDTVSAYHSALPNNSIAGNTIIIELRYQSPTQNVTWSDNVGGNTYTRAVQCVDTPRTTVAEIWYVKPTAGTYDIVPHFSPASKFVQSSAFEFYNVGALDQATCQAGSGTTAAVPALPTLASTGDLVFHFAVVDSTQLIAGCTAGSQANITWILRQAQIADKFPACMQYGVYNSTVSFSPSLTLQTSASYVTAAAAFRPASAGSAPPAGIRVNYLQHDNSENEQDATVPLQEPVSGNMFAVLFNSGCVDPSITDCAYPTSASDGTNTYTQVGSTTISPGVDGGAASANVWYAKGVSAGTYKPTWTMHARSSGGNGSTWIFYDISGASASAPLDTGMGLVAATGDQLTTGAGGNLTTITTTPSSTNEVILTLVGWGWNSSTGLASPTGSHFIASNYITENNPSHADLNSGGGVYYNGASLSSATWTFIQNASNFPGVGSWVSLGVAFH